MVTADWLSSAVENTCDFLVGIVVFSQSARSSRCPWFRYPATAGHVQQQHVMLFTGQYATWIAAPMATASSGFTSSALFAEEVGHGLLHHRHTSLTTDQDHVIDLRIPTGRILECGAYRIQ